jgi:hypothetical protein
MEQTLQKSKKTVNRIRAYNFGSTISLTDAPQSVCRMQERTLLVLCSGHLVDERHT